MKTLVNKNNPAIRITAPEITTEVAPFGNYPYVYWIPAINEMYNPIDWTLVDEEPTEDWREKRKKECPYRKADGCERYAGLISECNGICSWVVDYPKLKEIQDKKEQEQPDVDLEKELKNKKTILSDLFGPMNGEQSLAIKNFARHFYELGREGGSK